MSLIQLEYTKQDGTSKFRIVNIRLIDSIEADPRPNADSKSIVKLSDGTKLFCTQTPEAIMEKLK